MDAKAERQEHHVSFQESILCLKASVSRLEDFVNKLQGMNNPKAAEDDSPMLALSHFLDTDGSEIREQAERIDKLREEMQAALF